MLPRIVVGRDPTRVGVTAVLFIEVLLTTTIVVGCGESGPTDIEQVMAAISDLPDAARDAESFHTLFIDGAAPTDAERARYSQYVFNMDEPTVTENTAKVNVHVTNAQGDELGTQEWVFFFDGQWRIEHAPLP